MDAQYNPHAIEPEVQVQWAQKQAFKAVIDDSRSIFYCLSMFPYPSGHLHMGHVRNYTIGDVIARFERMRGKTVLQPMGWDAFGLPAENAAIKHQTAPHTWTQQNIDYMRQQLKRLGFSYDWSRELATCHKRYYQWEQWFFIELYKKGLVYRKNAVVNWDPIDKTVLANEQVIDGRGWRSGALVERREIPQWFIKITDYAQELLTDLDQLTEWPERVLSMQRHWIGRSEGVSLQFTLDGEAPLEVYTTRPDTLMGVTYVAIAPQHPLAQKLATDQTEVKDFIRACENIQVAEAQMATLEKAGVDTGVKAKHPITGKSIPVWVANYVLMDYGSGAVMAVPAHDQRDWEFARHYSLPIQAVIKAEVMAEAPDLTDGAFVEKGVLFNSGDFDGLSSQQAFDAIANELIEKQLGQRSVNYRLRDWGISRQRYWGAPIPMIHCSTCGVVPVPQEDLPVELPLDVQLDPTGGSVLKDNSAFVETSCPQCGGVAQRETDTFDTFMESSWYYARFTSPRNEQMMVGPEAQHCLPVDQYVGGIEHAVLHLLYARFFHKLMRDAELVPGDEPFKRLLCQGMVVAETYYRESERGHKVYFAPDEVSLSKDAKGQVTRATLLTDGEPVIIGGIEKMSKSKNNGVDPQALIDRYGADTVRLFTMFAAPPDQSLEWSETGVEGAYRYLKRLWKLVYEHVEAGAVQGKVLELDSHASFTAEQKALRQKIHQTVVKTTDDIARRHTFNTAIAAVMELTNALQKAQDTSAVGCAVLQEGLRMCVLILAPVTPHVCEVLWRALGGAKPLVESMWPKPDVSALQTETVTLVIQVNGKLRGRLQVSVDEAEDVWIRRAQGTSNIAKFMEGKTLVKTIVVSGKLINFVVK